MLVRAVGGGSGRLLRRGRRAERFVQRCKIFGDRLVARACAHREPALDHLVERFRHVGAMFAGQLPPSLRRRFHQKLIEDRRHRIEIGGRADRVGRRALLRRHVKRRADPSGRAAAVRARRADRLGDAEIENLQREIALRRIAAKQDVLGLQIAMHEAHAVRLADAGENGAHDPDRRVQAGFLTAADGVDEPGAQRAAFHIFHREEGLSVDLADVIHRDDVRMTDLSGRDAFRDEPLHRLLA